jgi:hypothetical protein
MEQDAMAEPKLVDIEFFRGKIDLDRADKDLTKTHTDPIRLIWDFFRDPSTFASYPAALQYLYLAILNDPRLVARALLKAVIEQTELGFDPKELVKTYLKSEYDDPEIGRTIENFLRDIFEEG